MLTITESAAELLASQRAQSGAPASYGARLFVPDVEEASDADLVIAFVPEPSPGDDVIEGERVRAFVAPDVSSQLEEATLDATPTNGTPPQLVLRR